MRAIDKVVASEDLEVLGWREVPTDPSMLGHGSRQAMPSFHQIFIGGGDTGARGINLERRVFMARKRIEHEFPTIYFPSLSTRTLIYKGMLTTPQLGDFYPDLTDERLDSALALVHSRFSTNTFPSWPLAHPYRYLAHNGEINTVTGNRNWMRAREALLEATCCPATWSASSRSSPPAPATRPASTRSLELLHLAGRPLPHAVLMMIPEAWENHQQMSPDKRAFYQFHASLMEPWDGPASIAFTDGTVIGAVLDRNGLRPSRFWVTDDGLVVMASEVGVLDIEPSRIVAAGPSATGSDVPGRHRPGPDRERRGDQVDPGRRAPLRRLAARRQGPPRRPRPPLHPHAPALVGDHPPTAVRLHHRRPEDHPRPHGQDRRRTARLDGHRHPDRRPVGATPAAVRLLPAAFRPSDQPAPRRHARGAGHLARRHDRPRAEPPRARPGQLPPDRAAPAHHHQRGAGQAHLHQRRRRHARLAGLRHRRAVPGHR